MPNFQTDYPQFNKPMYPELQNLPTSPSSPSGGTNLPPEWQALLDEYKRIIEELRRRGQVLNPNIQISPEKMAEFTKQAETEINPYYQTQNKLARESILRDSGYSTQQLGLFEQDLERKYGQQVRQLGESAAERGFAQSGIRQLEEQNLATDTQRTLEDQRRQLGFQAGTQARQFAQQYGTPQFDIPQIQQAPRVLPGQGTFERPGGTSPFYELSPSTYDGLVGTKQFEQRGAIKSRASELEEAFRRQQMINQQRQLTI